MYDVLIIDGNNFARRALHAHSRLSVRKDSGKIGTGLIYGFYEIVSTILNQMEGNPRIYVAWDKGRGKRTKIYSEYKATRDKKDKDPKKQKQKDELNLEFKKQMNMIQRILKLNGIYQVFIPKEEADDVIGTSSRKFQKQGKKVLIVSGDHDMLQLIDDNVDLCLARSQGNSFWNVSKFEKKYGFHPSKMIDVMSLTGDPGDNIPGIKGIGDAKATRIVKANLDLVSQILGNKIDSKAVLNDASVKEGELILKNLEAVKLAHSLVKIDCQMEGMKFLKPKKDFEELKEIFEFLEFNSYLNKNKWEEIERMGN